MNILLLTCEFAPATGGIGRYAREIASAATDLGANVTVIAPDYAQDTTTDDRSLPLEVRRFSGGLHSMRDLPSKILLARSHVGAERYDVIHAADWPFFIPVALSRNLTPARILMTVHGTEINETQTPLKRLAIRSASAFGSRTEIAANSRYTRELFRQRFAIDPQRINAIPFGVSDFWFGQRIGRAATRAAYGIAPERLVIVTVSRITGAADFFCLTGVPDSSGRVEGFGLVYLEAAAGGLPSVATAIGGVPDAVLADETGLLVPPSVEAIARAITTLAEDTDTRSILAAGASTHARALSWERCAAETYGLSRSARRSLDDISEGLFATHPRQIDSIPQIHPV